MKNLLLVATSAIEPIFRRRKDCHNRKSYHITKRFPTKDAWNWYINILYKFELFDPVNRSEVSLIPEELELMKISSDAKNEKSEPDFGQDVYKKSYWSWKSQEKTKYCRRYLCNSAGQVWCREITVHRNGPCQLKSLDKLQRAIAEVGVAVVSQNPQS